MMGIKKQKIRYKKICSKIMRRALTLLGVGLLAGGCMVFYALAQPMEETIENTILSYKVTADSAYKVHLLPNELIKDEWLPEGMIYSEKLTDYIEIILSADIASDKKAVLGGSYQITAIIEGYQSGVNSKKTIYKKELKLKQGIISKIEEKQAKIQETIKVIPLNYRKQVEKAEQILGSSTSKDIYLLFNGVFQIETEEGLEEKSFSYILPIPVGMNSSFYEILKPNASVEEGKITELISINKQPNKKRQIMATGVTGMGVMMLLFVMLGTKLPNKEEKRHMDMLKIMRKYGSRMVQLETLPEFCHKEQLHLKDMDSMIIVSEELRQPILYSLDHENMPVAGLFFIPNGKKVYVFQYPKVPTTLGVAGGGESGSEM